jgi:hypothetical protein
MKDPKELTRPCQTSYPTERIAKLSEPMTIDANDGTERIPPELVGELDDVFSDVPGVDTVALAAILLKLTGKYQIDL